MTSYEETRLKLTNTQMTKLKPATARRITKKNVQDDEFPHELFLITRQKIKIRNVFVNNILTNIKLSKAQLPKVIQSGFLVKG